MATIVQNEQMRRLLKTVYLDGVYNAKYQNSPVLSAIKKESWGSGDTLKYAAQYGNGGNFGSRYGTLKSAMTEGVRNIEWEMTQGYLTGLFSINQPEMLTTAEARGAYMKALSNKMAGCFDGLSKLLAMYLYGGKYGVIDTVVEAPAAAVAASGNKMKLHSSGAIKMDVGLRFQIMSGSVPDASNLKSTVYTVSAIDDNEITFSASVTGDTIAVGDTVVLYTAINNNGEAVGIEGLAEIIPAYADRKGADWENYISSPFRGVKRDVAVNRLAGQFVKAEATGDTRLSDALVSLLKKTKRAGGLNNMIIVNDETWDAIGSELGIQRNLWQATDGAASKQGATFGINELATAFGDAFIGRTVIDPYCQEGYAYSLEKDDLTFYDLGNVSKVINPVSNDQLGKHNIESVGDAGFGNTIDTKINVDKLFNVGFGNPGDYGEEVVVSANIFGNFGLKKTASAGVAVLG